MERKELTTEELLELGRLQEEQITIFEKIDNWGESDYLLYRLGYINESIRVLEK